MSEDSFGEKIRLALQNLEHTTVDVIYDRRKDLPARIYGCFLKGLSWIFCGIVKFRYFLYKNRIFRDCPLGCLVIVVGNLTVGGTGKTPVVEKFARELTAKGRKVAILSRGYKSKSDGLFKKLWRWITNGELPKPKVVSDGKNILLNSEFAGDEPFMLARNLPGVVVVVDKNRVRAGNFAIKEFGVDTLILDDGFQYLPLRGHMQLLLVDKTNPFGNKSLLPRGILREPVSHLKRASYIFLTKSDGRRDEELENFIRQYNTGAEFIECAHKSKHLVEFHSMKQEPIEFLKGKKIAYFCAIASPSSFEKFLVDAGAEIVYFEHFLDHHRFLKSELDDFFKDAVRAGAEYVLTTEKDAVRIDLDYGNALPFYYTRLEIEILSGTGGFDSAVERICFKRNVE